MPDENPRIRWLDDQSDQTPKEQRNITRPAQAEIVNERTETPNLDQFGRDLTKLAREGKLSPLFGRKKELLKLQRILLRKTKSNPLLVGAAGVGKTALVEGLAIAIEATNASSDINVGVGGSPSIMYVAKDGVIVPNENQCILASEIIRGMTRGYLARDFALEKVYGLVVKGADFEKTDEEMKSAATDWRKFELSLRGYKE